MSNDSSVQKHRSSLLRVSDKVLLPGSISEMHFHLLVSISSIHSYRAILAMKEYLVDGVPRKEACIKYSLNNGYFSTTISKLIRVNDLAARLSFYYKDA